MLKPAQLYKDALRRRFLESWYNMEDMYWHGATGAELIELPDDNYNKHCFVSISSDGGIMGYIAYNVDWQAMSADRWGIISFNKGSIEFAKDVYQAICNVFEIYHMNRISWFAYVDNPAIRGYRNFIKKHGGRECGYYRQIAKLMDGNLHDAVEFEILAEEFVRKNKDRRIL